jgi:type I restriction enzyme S subunit
VSQLPKGWAEIELKSICKFIDYRGKTPKKIASGLPLITAKNIRNGFINREPREFVSEDSYDDWMVRGIPLKGDILITTEAPLGNVASIDIDEKFVLAQRAICLQMFDKSLSRFMQYFLRSPEFQKKLHELSTGTTVKGIKSSRLKEMKVWVAPLIEKQLIADKLDSMLAKVDAAQARLEKIPNILKRFRQSVLAAATSGELTKEWRGGSDHQWPNVKLKDVGKGFNYGSSAKSKPEGEVPVLRMGNLQGGLLDWEKLVYTSDEAEIKKYLLETGDVLFNRTNSPELVGKTSIYRGEQKAIYAGYLIRVKGSDRLNTEYLNIQLNSPHARDYCWQVKTDGVSQSNINAKKLQAYEFDLPEIDEQLEIVRRVSELFSHASLFERQYLNTQKKFNQLTQSILAKAFRGELVEQDPNDEPANKLIKRIKQQQIDTQQAAKETNNTKDNVKPDIEVIAKVIESSQQKSEVLTLLQKSKSELTAQQILANLTEQTFEQVDGLFTELKRLLDNHTIAKVGIGENCTFKAIKK